MEIVIKKIDELHGAEYNPRVALKPGDAEFEKIARSIEEFGYVDPVIINKDGTIIGGHQRCSVLKTLGYTEIKCVQVDFDKNKEKACNIALNKITGSWDEGKLKDLLIELESSDYDATLTGFDDDELTQIIGDVEVKQEAIEDDFNEETDQVETQAKYGQVYKLGEHRLMCGDSTSLEDVAKLMGGQKVDLFLTDPPYNVDYEGIAGKIMNDKQEDSSFRQFLIDVYKAADSVMKPGCPFYIWHADSESYNFRGACRDVEWKVRECLIWVKNSLVLGRQDYQWQHEPCQPAGTKVLTTDGIKNIEDLKDGDHVISFDTYSGQVKGYKNGGYEIKTAKRHYKGTLYGINAAGKKTWATNNHEFSVRFKADNNNNYCTYLMRRGNWWRVGMTKAYDSRQFGLKTRMHQELGDEVWLISTHSNKIEAQVMEQILTCKYGIPYTIWEPYASARTCQRTPEQIEEIYNALDLEKLKTSAIKLLHDFNRDEKYPLISKDTINVKFSTRVTAKINACNLVAGLMEVPIPTKTTDTKNFEWVEISEVEHKDYDDTVYSLAVEKYHHYIADGIITHNCLYGWKDGAGHYFIDKRTETTVIEDKINVDKLNKDELKDLCKKLLDPKVQTTIIREKRPAVNDVHPTMKPVKLFSKLVVNSSKANENVLDLFGGSGTTMIACEQLNRKAYLMELDPHYVDVIIARWEKFTGKKAELIEE